jgi:hypothetical protein
VVIAVALVITGGSLGVLHWIHPQASVGDELLATTLSGFLATAVRFTLLRHWIFRRARHRSPLARAEGPDARDRRADCRGSRVQVFRRHRRVKAEPYRRLRNLGGNPYGGQHG